MGFFSAPKSQPIAAQDVAPAPVNPGEPDPVDPASLDRARQRARDAESRKTRKKLRIPLGSATGDLGSGLQIV